MIVLSLFDGIGCGQVALQRAGIRVDQYFASEIDKYAIKVTLKTFPNTVEVGDITKLSYSNDVLTSEIGKIHIGQIGLVMGGSPCQGFSFAGRGLNFSDPRSQLFFEFVRLLREVNPKYFLLENVRMKKEFQDVISKELGVEPIMINSALVSAQNWVRLYWTNIQGITQPEDRHSYLRDIIESGDVNRDKAYCIDANYFKGGNLKSYFEKARKQLVIEKSQQSSKRLMVRCVQVGEADLKGNDSIKRVYSINGKSPTLTTMGGGHREPKISEDNITWRKLTPLECERLQTLPDGYTEGISNTQRYKALGNGWTVDVIAHILSFIPKGV